MQRMAEIVRAFPPLQGNSKPVISCIIKAGTFNERPKIPGVNSIRYL
jgi:hypothetical protein